ncbi:MAG: GNAT family N-acetyltransferase [Acidimicrobiia bacterium]|nr:GNAT family N-acetyltransferase [Acidimicrobiia bacterium]
MENVFLAPLSTTIDGLHIRPLRAGDGVEYTEVVNASYSTLSKWLNWPVENMSVEQGEEMVRERGGAYLKGERFPVCAWEDGVLIGGSGYRGAVDFMTTGNVELGMWIRGDRAGQGLGTRFLRAMVQWGFEEWGWHRMKWECDTRNRASSRTAEKAGFTLEGTTRSDMAEDDGTRSSGLVYSILRSEWEDSR